MSGIFDFFKKKKLPEEERGLSVPLPEASIFDVFRPSEARLPAPRPETPPAAPPPEPERRPPGLLRMFEAFVPAPPPPAPALPAPPGEAAPSAPALWEEIFFGPPAAAEEPPLQEIFQPPPMITPPPIYVPPPREPAPAGPPAAAPPGYTFIRIPGAPPGLPTPEQMAAHLRGQVDVDAAMRTVAVARQSPDWSQSIAERAAQGMPVLLQIQPVVTREVFTDLSTFLGVPFSVFESYLSGARTEEEQEAAFQRWVNEVVLPLSDVVSEAFELMKPREFPGWFSVAFDPGTGTWWLYYVEALLTSQVPRAIPRLPYYGGQQSA